MTFRPCFSYRTRFSPRSFRNSLRKQLRQISETPGTSGTISKLKSHRHHRYTKVYTGTAATETIQIPFEVPSVRPVPSGSSDRGGSPDGCSVVSGWNQSRMSTVSQNLSPIFEAIMG